MGSFFASLLGSAGLKALVDAFAGPVESIFHDYIQGRISKEQLQEKLQEAILAAFSQVEAQYLDSITKTYTAFIQVAAQNPAMVKAWSVVLYSQLFVLFWHQFCIPAIVALGVVDKYPKAALLISTSAPRLTARGWDELCEASKDIPTIGLQFSVHESTDEARDALIPFKGKMSLREIVVAGEGWYDLTGRNPFFNYCAHDGNETDADADRIARLFNPSVFCATVSVVCERSEGLPATNQHQRDLATSFASRLVQRGFDVRVFDPAGQDTIGGGCGQLWFVQQWMKDHPDQVRPSIGHGMPEVHAPAA
ncbi:hypothetical protein [Bradyrhizobium diversitatis]|uniref:Uncharacterized protein n=1 Tax=Bradyrhizobium diversitatis TaxID=2755406 RepID=A0ABS0P755_9BRAD|nr:hypothetical protein [Bradyrhizobium diversitatis]MBH5389143.1 hypothetical protein [Bradyrhizobium diversitatis]